MGGDSGGRVEVVEVEGKERGSCEVRRDGEQRK